MKTGVLLVNLGTPDSPSVPNVRKYLRQFLMDGRVIDIPFLSRFLLVNGIIAPFRAPKSSKVYKSVWTENGSPLKYYSVELTKLVQKSLGDDFHVELGMRYQSPSIASALDKLLDKGYNKIVVLPLFPQYASASTGSVQEEVMRLVAKKQIVPSIQFISNFFDHPMFINAFSLLAKKYLDEQKFDHILFSYHGLPERQIKKGDCTGTCLVNENCCGTIHDMNYYCYRAQCFESTRLIAKQLGLAEQDYSVCFQSRLGKTPWIKPYADDVIENLPKQGKKRVLILVPSFVSDCLETIEEVGDEYKELFMYNGGEHWQMVESLNLSPAWVETVKILVSGQ
ncbi:MAG: ferrochelatase [Cytophagales bacterium]